MTRPKQTTYMAGEEFLPGLSLPVSIRTSPKAKNMLVRLLPGTGLEVVLPRGVGHGAAAGLLERKRAWIERTVARMAAQGADFSGTLPDLPDRLTLPGAKLDLSLAYLENPGNLRLTENIGKLTLIGPTSDHLRVFSRLKEYIRATAKTVLPPLLRTMSTRFDLPFDDVQIRCQKTRWGSCSKRVHHTLISLNAKLLFLPVPLSDQVLLHELCHTRFGDHSKRYWALVERLNPEARALERELSTGWNFIPDWWRAAS